MATVTKAGLGKVLTERLGLRDPEFRLEKSSGRLFGKIISKTFAGKQDHQRQKMIWDALQSEYGEDAIRRVGMILAYTPGEWNLGAEEAPALRRMKKAG